MNNTRTYFHRSTCKKTNGFTLIEVMVALAIIAIALASLIKASGTHTHSAGYLKSKTLAHYVAMNEVVQLQVKKVWPDLGDSDKSTEMAGIEWFWTREVEKTRSENIRGVSFTVYLDENRTRNLAKIKAFISNPANNNRQPAPINNQNNTNNATGNTGTGQRN